MRYQPSLRMSRREYLRTIDYFVNPASREARMGRSESVPFESIILENTPLFGLRGKKFDAASIRLRESKGFFSRVYIPNVGVSRAELLLEAERLPVSDADGGKFPMPVNYSTNVPGLENN